MRLAHQKPTKEVAELNRRIFLERFKNLKKSVDIDKPHLSYIPTYEYSSENRIAETRYQHDQQPS